MPASWMRKAGSRGEGESEWSQCSGSGEDSIAFESLLVCRKLVRKGEKSEERGNEHEGQIIEST